MSIAPAAAANAYALAARITDPVQAKAAATTPQGSFGGMVEQAISTISEAGTQSDKAVMAAATGKADIVDVVTAVAETELALQTLVSVRDRVISSYESIMRMPI